VDDSQDVANRFCVLLEAAIMTHAWFASSGRETQKAACFVIYSRAMPIARRVVRVLVGWGRLKAGDFHFFALHVYQKMLENPAFPNPPVDLSLLKADVDRLAALIAAASYGDSRVLIERDQVRSDIHLLLRQLAHYVEDQCQDDRAAAESSGFDLMPSSAAARSMLPPRITRIDHRLTGELHVRYTTVGRGALKYEIRSAKQGTPDPDSWPIRVLPNAKDGALFDGLTPGAVYTFQVRAFSASGPTHWSPAVDKMCN
jgi:hypothetical protein